MRIVQISDLHLKPEGELAYDAADTASCLARTVAHIGRLSPGPDAVIVTGDVADGGGLESYRRARELLSPLQMPLFLIPGNHDHKGRMAEVFSDHDRLRPGFDPRAGGFVCYTVEGFPLRLVALDTVNPGDHGGGLCRRRLAWLDTVLGERPDMPTLLYMHHPPFPSGVGHMDLEPFRRRDGLEAVVRRHPQVVRLTCGHIHRPITTGFGGTAATVCPGVGMQIPMDLRPDAPSGFVEGPPGLLMHCLAEGWGDPPVLVTHVDLVEDEPGQFGGFHPFFDVASPE